MCPSLPCIVCFLRVADEEVAEDVVSGQYEVLREAVRL